MYELAFHIMPDLEEAAVATRAQDIETLITQTGGSVIGSRAPKKIHLSYPIAHQHYGHFGVVEFQAGAEAITGLNAQLKLQDGVLRFLIVKKPEGKELRTLGDPRIRRTRTHVAPTHKAEGISETKPKQEEKVIEKELENVLEKL